MTSFRHNNTISEDKYTKTELHFCFELWSCWLQVRRLQEKCCVRFLPIKLYFSMSEKCITKIPSNQLFPQFKVELDSIMRSLSYKWRFQFELAPERWRLWIIEPIVVPVELNWELAAEWIVIHPIQFRSFWGVGISRCVWLLFGFPYLLLVARTTIYGTSNKIDESSSIKQLGIANHSRHFEEANAFTKIKLLNMFGHWLGSYSTLTHIYVCKCHQ